MTDTQISTITADGVDIFYRSAGSTSDPVILLLHGFPSSSHMFRNLIPLLSKQYRVIAPDFPGFGFTTVPTDRKYEYTFENLTHTTEAFLDALKIKNFAVYIFDYGAPVAFRLALDRPKAITAIVTQNGNAYEEGLGKDFWAPVQTYWKSGSKEDRDKIESAVLNFDATKWQYTFGSPHPDSIYPESYHLDSALLERPGNHGIQLDLLYDYGTNVPLYPRFQQYLETSGVPVLATWGKNDPIFIAPGAEAYKKHVKDIKIHYLDAGHFALETNEVEVSKLIADFLKEHGYDSIDYKIFLVLSHFLQPDSTLSSIDAAEHVIGVFPYKYPDLRQLISVCFEIAEQIPYHHPSQIKLVRLLWIVGRSAIHFEKPYQKNPSASVSHHRTSEFYERLTEATIDYEFDPGAGDVDPARYVNSQAFLSLVMEAGCWIPTTRPVLHVMSRTFEKSHEEEPTEIREAWIMGAAQWILWSGQSVFKLHLDPISRMRHKTTPLRNLEVIITTRPIELDMWHKWTGEFRKAANCDDFGEECRGVAMRAADLMEALEKAML